jgi:hypothetical protein
VVEGGKSVRLTLVVAVLTALYYENAGSNNSVRASKPEIQEVLYGRKIQGRPFGYYLGFQDIVLAASR